LDGFEHVVDFGVFLYVEVVEGVVADLIFCGVLDFFDFVVGLLKARAFFAGRSLLVRGQGR
jgi:hypothetical protein